jgi:kynurenine formamidase
MQKISFPYRIIDLTHTLHDDIPAWEGRCGYHHEIQLDYENCSSDVKFRVQNISMNAGIGTHIDAPAHCIPNGLTVDDLVLSDLIAPCLVVDVSEQAHERYSVSIEDIQAFEVHYGPITPGCFIMIRTGWEKWWNDPDQYRNHYRYPSVSGMAAEYCLQRGIVGLGIDTLSPDRPDDGYPVHAAILGAGKYIVENAANLSELPRVGSYILALPIKTKGGTEAPIRLIALT